MVNNMDLFRYWYTMYHLIYYHNTSSRINYKEYWHNAIKNMYNIYGNKH